MGGLKIINDVLKLSFSERIGLRYLDAVLPKEGESLKDYLTPEVLGLSSKVSDFVHSFSETLTVHNFGHTVSRVIIQTGQVGLTPELAVLAPQLDAKFSAYNGLHAILDTDASHEQRQAFKLDNVEKTLLELKASIRATFKATVTPTALSIWQGNGA
jgi:uncharacterized protein (TIGR04255 family)